MTIPEEGIGAILTAANIVGAGSNGWPIYYGRLSTTVDQCVAIRSTGGRTPEVKVAIDYPSVQVLVRGTKSGYAVSRAKAQAIFEALQALPTGPTGPAEYPELVSCIAMGHIASLGYDANDRPIWSINFNLIVAYAAQGNRE